MIHRKLDPVSCSFYMETLSYKSSMLFGFVIFIMMFLSPPRNNCNPDFSFKFVKLKIFDCHWATLCSVPSYVRGPQALLRLPRRPPLEHWRTVPHYSPRLSNSQIPLFLTAVIPSSCSAPCSSSTTLNISLRSPLLRHLLDYFLPSSLITNNSPINPKIMELRCHYERNLHNPKLSCYDEK